MKNYMLPIVFVLLFFAACTPQQDATDTIADDMMDDAQAEEALADEGQAAADDGALDELMELFDEQADLEYQVEYDVTTTADGETMTSQMGQYLKGADHMRIDMMTQGVEMRTYMVEDTYSTCMNQDGWSCFAFEGSEDDGAAFDANEFREEFEADPVDYEVNLMAPRTIVGAVTACFEIVSEDSTVEYCMTRSGVPLYVHLTAEGTQSTMTATSFSESVPASAFELPAEPGDMGAMMGFDPSDFDY